KVASFYFLRHKYDKALAVLDSDSTDRRTQQQRLETLLADNQITEAQKYVTKLLVARPDDVQFLEMQGLLLFQQKKLPEALAVLNQSLNIEPRNPTALYYRGMIKLRHGPSASDEAIKDLTAAKNLLLDESEDRFTAPVHTKIQTRMAL